ncbi:MAG: DUF4340 domain-containing protein [Planctomycetota bacterium]|nr:DUF4340 domain-containing protein [Planctomycetota bacterium]
MNRTSLAVLALITALVVIAAVVSYSRRQSEPASPGSEHLYPALEDHVNDVASITIRTGDGEFMISRHEGDWGLQTKGGYPVSFEKVKQTILGLADLRIIEPKTSRPEYYDRLGVNEPGPDAEAVLITLNDAAGDALASLVIGDPAGASGRVPRRFVRKIDQARAWLVQGQLTVHERPLDWVEREILRLPRTRVQSVTITHPDGERIHLQRDDQSRRNFAVDDVPEGYELQSDAIANPIANALGFLRMEDVAPIDEIDFAPGEVATVEFRCFNGLLVTLELLPTDEGAWIELCASADGDAVPAEPEPDVETPPDTAATQAGEINDRVTGWAFRISQSTVNILLKRMSDLTRPVEPEPDQPQDNGGTEEVDAG